MQTTISLRVNGQPVEVSAMPDTPLLLILRNDLWLNGPKYGCGLGECGACTVIIDGVAARSCVIPLAGAAGAISPPSKGWAARPRHTRCNRRSSTNRQHSAATA